MTNWENKLLPWKKMNKRKENESKNSLKKDEKFNSQVGGGGGRR